MNKVGLVFFDNADSPSGGISYFNGEINHFETLSDLDMSKAWIADLPYTKYRNARFNQLSHLRPEQFLRIGVSNILRELGLKRNMEGAEVLGEFVDAIVEDMESIVGCDPHIQSYRLNYGTLNRLMPDYYAEVTRNSNSDIQTALKNAFQLNQGSVKSDHIKNAKLHHYTLPRVAHFEYIMNQMFPISNNWEEISGMKFPITTGTKRGDKVENFEEVRTALLNLHLSKACILNVHVKSMENNRMQGFAFGVEGGKSNIRVWAALPEVLNLMNYAEVEIVGGIQTQSGYLPISPEIDLNTNRYSYPRGIVAENIWTGLSDQVELNGVKHATGLGVYLRAYDRIICGKLAEAFANQNYKLGGFGTGVVRVWAMEQDKRKLNDIALRFGAMEDLRG